MEYIENKWYKLSSGKYELSEEWYVKFRGITRNAITASNYIHNKIFESVKLSHFGQIGDYTLTEINILEIIDYLPEDHPDIIEYNRIKPVNCNYLIQILKKYGIK